MTEPQILYRDRDLLLCVKPAGMPSQPDPSGQPDLLTALSMQFGRVGLVHRLDTPTGGVMVYSLNPRVTGKLCTLVQDHERFVKEYLAVLSNPPPAEEGALTDFLFHDRRANKAYVVDSARKGSREAKLAYRTQALEPIPLPAETAESTESTESAATSPTPHALIRVRLYTGRTHQIRVQFASRGCPLTGDGKYGSREKCGGAALWSFRLTFPHPVTGKTISAVSLPDRTKAPWSLFSVADYPAEP